MGQYYLIVNVTKRQYLHPHRFGSGLKLMEFSRDENGPLSGLAVLLADGNNRGGGDLRTDDKLVGSWAGDKVVIAGDYADAGKFLDGLEFSPKETKAIDKYGDGKAIAELNLYSIARACFKDISDRVIAVIAAAEGPDHPYSRMDLQAEVRTRPAWGAPVPAE